MTPEEIAGALWDVQSTNIAEGSVYSGDAGKAKFIQDYSGSFSDYADSTQSTLSNLEGITEDVKVSRAEESLEFFTDWQTKQIESEGKWWGDTGFQDDETGEYVESKKELLTRHTAETDKTMDKIERVKIQEAVANYTKTREAALFEQELKGVKNNDTADSLRTKLWQEVSTIRDNFSDQKDDRNKKVERTVRDNTEHVDRGWENLAAGISGQELDIQHAEESRDIKDLRSKEAATSAFGTELWRTMRRISSTGVFDEPIPPLEDPPKPKNKCFHPDSIVFTSRGKIKISDLQVNDYVETEDKQGNRFFTRVYAWLHKSDLQTDYIEISTQNESIKLSVGHRIFSNNKYILAENVKVGDELSSGKVIKIGAVIGVGSYAPATTSGTLLVDNILASCYVIYGHSFSHFMVKGILYPLTLIWPNASNWLDKRGVNKVAYLSKILGNKAGI